MDERILADHRLEADRDNHYADAEIKACLWHYRAGDEADVLRQLDQLDNGQLVEIISLDWHWVTQP